MVKEEKISDGHLIDQTLAGDSAAYGRLVCKYQDRLYNAVVHIIGNATDAEDVVQDAFVQAYLKLSTFKRDSALYTWLYRIAFNAAISKRRRKKPEVSVEHHREVTGDEPLGRDHHVGRTLEDQEDRTLINTALQQLSEEHRTIIILREMNGVRYDELAEMLGIEVGTVRSRLHRARSHLREILTDMLPDQSGGQP